MSVCSGGFGSVDQPCFVRATSDPGLTGCPGRVVYVGAALRIRTPYPTTVRCAPRTGSACWNPAQERDARGACSWNRNVLIRSPSPWSPGRPGDPSCIAWVVPASSGFWASLASGPIQTSPRRHISPITADTIARADEITALVTPSKQGRVHAQAQRCGRKGGPCCAAPDRPCGDPFLCINGSCEEPIPGGPCPDGQLECSGRCVDLRADAANCGDCGVACESGQGCCDGVCDTSCVCQPKCEGRECGPDGCGGTCGTCAGTTCSTSTCDEDAGRCVRAPMAGCCQTDVDCDDENSCTTDTCVNGTCQHSTRDNFSVCGATATGNCQHGVCETCRATQLPCEDNRQCCDFQRQAWGGWCAPSIDFPGFSVCCRNQGMSCGTGSDCCTGVCTAGGCSCRDAARTCTNARQCCSGVCGPNTHGQLVCI
jgi:hypothetical protein